MTIAALLLLGMAAIGAYYLCWPVVVIYGFASIDMSLFVVRCRKLLGRWP